MSYLFPVGHVVATPGAIAILDKAGTSARDLLARHTSGDFGQLCDEDRRANFSAIENSLRILSSYPVSRDGQRVWVITEADRSVTTFLLPEEY